MNSSSLESSITQEIAFLNIFPLVGSRRDPCEAHQWGKEELFALTNIPLCSIDLHYQLHRDVSNYCRVSRSFHYNH